MVRISAFQAGDLGSIPSYRIKTFDKMFWKKMNVFFINHITKMWCCTNNQINDIVQIPTSIMDIPNLDSDVYEERSIFNELKAQWQQHVVHYSKFYKDLMIQDKDIQRAPFVIYDRQTVKLDLSMPTPYVCYKPELKIRSIKPPISRLCPCHPSYPEKDIQHLNIMMECSEKLFRLLDAMNTYFPFVCRYYGTSDPTSKWGSKDFFINPYDHEQIDIRNLIQTIYNKIYTSNLKIYTKNDRREYTMWFVYNHINKIQESDTFLPKSCIYYCIMLYEYIEEMIMEHIKKAL